MEAIQDIFEFTTSNRTAITIGTFDGVHIGHRKILERLINNAKSTGTKSLVLTFFPHPRMVLQKDANIKLLNTLEEKEQILREIGLDYLIVHPFTQKFSRLTALEFVRDVLANQLKVKNVVIGYDHRFGRNRNANINDLKLYGETYDFDVEEIPAQEISDVSVSSTKIRAALNEGDIETANSYLGYPYLLTGHIVKGKGIGKKMGFPTANLQIKETYKLIPQNGVYIAQSELAGKTVYGMMNIGFNPTVSGTQQSIEIHFFDVDQDLYGQKLQLRLLKKIRNEKKFDSLEKLIAQLEQDKITSLAYLENGIPK